MQTADFLIILFPCLALLLLGLSVAGFYYWWTSTKKDKQDSAEPISDATNLEDIIPSTPVAEPPQPVVQPQTAKTVPAPMPSLQAATAPVSDGNTVEVMRVLRDISDGSIVIQINGQQYYSLKEMTDPKVGKRFLGNAQAVAEFARLKQLAGSNSLLPPTSIEPAPPAPKRSTLPEMPPIESVSMADTDVDPLANANWLEDTAPMEDKRSSTLRDSLLGASPSAPTMMSSPTKPMPTPPKPTEPEPIKAFEPPSKSPASEVLEEDEDAEPVSIVDQIEETLQQRLREHPNFRYRTMHIRQAPDGGVRVEVDGTFFDGVGDVADEEAKAFIQSVIREWEARQ